MARGQGFGKATVEQVVADNTDYVARFLAYQAHQRRSSSRTVYDYAFRLRELVDHLGPRPLGEAKLYELEEFTTRPRERCQDGKPRPATVAKDAAVVRSLYAYLESHDLIRRNPARGLHGPTPHNDHPRPVDDEVWLSLWTHPSLDNSAGRSASDASEAGLARQTAHVARVTLGLGYFVGLRRAEIAGLEVAQVSPLARRLIGFTRKGGGDDITPYGEMVGVIEDHLPDLFGPDGPDSFLRPLHGLVKARSGHRYLLPWGEQQSMDAEKRRIHALPHPHANDPDWVNRETRRWNRRAGLGESAVMPHMLRHSAATNLCRAGLPLHMVRDLMNHSSMAVTQRYVKVGVDSVAEWRARARTLRLMDGVDLRDYRRQ